MPRKSLSFPVRFPTSPKPLGELILACGPPVVDSTGTEANDAGRIAALSSVRMEGAARGPGERGDQSQPDVSAGVSLAGTGTIMPKSITVSTKPSEAGWVR